MSDQTQITPTEALHAFLAIGFVVLVGSIIGIGTWLTFGLNPFGGSLLASGGMWLYRWVVDRWMIKNERIAAIQHYRTLTFKKYRINLVCQSCGNQNVVEMDLSNTEFDCSHCGVKNAIYTNFSTAVVTDPMYDVHDILVAKAEGEHQHPNKDEFET